MQTAMIEYVKVNESLLNIVVESARVGSVVVYPDGTLNVFLLDKNHFPDIDINEAIAILLND